MRKPFDRVTLWMIDRPWVTWSILIVMTLLAIGGYTNPEKLKRAFLRFQPPKTTAADNSSTTEKAETRARPIPNVQAADLSDADTMIVVDCDSFFTEEGVTALREVVAKIESLDHVASVLWMDRVPILNIFGLPEPLFPRVQGSPQRYIASREKAMRNPLIRGQLLSADGKSTLLMIRFDWAMVRSDEACTSELRLAAEEVMKNHPKVTMRFQVTGRVPMFIAAKRSHLENQWKYQVIGYGMIALMSLILFRGISAVLIVAFAPALGVFWTMGMLRYFDLQWNPFNDVILPILLSLVGLTDGVHLMVQIRKLRAAGLNGKEAGRKGIHDVGFACLLTSLTTAIGFASLATAHNQVVREFGWSCVLGVIVTFIAVIVAIPIGCGTWLGRSLHVGLEKSLIDRNLAKISIIIDFVMKYAKPLTVCAIVSTAVFTYFAVQLRPDERNINALPGGSEAAAGLGYMDRTFGGLEFATIEVVWDRDVEWESPELLTVLGKLHQLVAKEPLIGHPISLKSLVDSLPGEGSVEDRMPMAELLPPPLKRVFYLPEAYTASMRFRVQDLGIATYAEVFERLEAGMKEISKEHPKYKLNLDGSAAWRWRNLYRIVMDLASSLGSASIIIFIVLGIAYRSVRMGLISIIPNVFPLALTGAILHWFGASLELVTVCAFTIYLGIAVDDTIHFLTRVEQERETCGDMETVIRNSFTAVGSSLIMTSVILVAGFATVLGSDSRDHRIFAWMGVICISSALFGDLVFLPAMLKVFGKTKIKSADAGMTSQTGGDAIVDPAAAVRYDPCQQR